MDGIREWLNGTRNYDAGVQLLLQHSGNAKLKRLFTSEAASDFKRSLLGKELAALVTGAAVAKQVQEEQQQQVVQRVAVAHNGWPQQMDEVLQALHAQWKPLFSELNALSSRLYDVAKAGKQDEAGRMAHRILDLDDECDGIYEKRDHYLEHGKLPNQAAPGGAVVDPLKWPLALSNAQRQLREARLRLQKAPNNERIAATIRKNEGLVAHYKQLLKLD